jgi:hypothetical protein
VRAAPGPLSAAAGLAGGALDRPATAAGIAAPARRAPLSLPSSDSLLRSSFAATGDRDGAPGVVDRRANTRGREAWQRTAPDPSAGLHGWTSGDRSVRPAYRG